MELSLSDALEDTRSDPHNKKNMLAGMARDSATSQRSRQPRCSRTGPRLTMRGAVWVLTRPSKPLKGCDNPL